MLIKIDPAKRNLIVVSTYNRQDLTALCLDSIAKNKSPRSSVVILDDASTQYTKEWLEQWGWQVIRREETIGVGMASRARFSRAAESPDGFGFFVLVDSDVTFGQDFDARMRSICEGVPYGSLVSGYRSVAYDVVERFPDYVQVKRVGGACLGLTRSTAQTVLAELDWTTLWDQDTGKFNCYCPRRSLAQHLGTSGTGQNGLSWDVAFDFVGEGLW